MSNALEALSGVGLKPYVITFSVTGVNIPSFVQYLHDSMDIAAYWNYVPLVYCVKTRLSATDLAHKIAHFFPNGGFFIVQVNPFNMDGALPNAAWQWFYLQHHEKHQSPANPYYNALLPFLKRD